MKSMLAILFLLLILIIPTTYADDPSGALFGMMTDMHSEFVDIVKVGERYPHGGRMVRANQCQASALALTNNIISAQFGQEQILGLLDTYFDFLKDPTGLEDQAKEAGKSLLSHIWDKINEGDNEELEYEPGWLRGDPELRACNAKLNVVWDKEARQIKIKVTGDCECKYRNMREFEVDITRDIVLRRDRSGGFMMEAVTKDMTIRANCDCTTPRNETSIGIFSGLVNFIGGLFSGGDEETPQEEEEAKTQEPPTTTGAQPPTTTGQGGSRTQPPANDYPDPESGSTRDSPLLPREELTPPIKEEPPRTDCPKCKSIEEQIRVLMDKKFELEKDILNLKSKLPDLNERRRRIQNTLDDFQKELDALNDPSSWAESEGRRVTNIDLRLQRMASRELWQSYQNGEMTAQELEDAWKKLDEEGANKDLLDKAKKAIQDDMARAQADLEKADQEIQKINEDITSNQRKIEEIAKEIEKLLAELEECKKRCILGVEKEDIIIGDGFDTDDETDSVCPSGSYTDAQCSGSCVSNQQCAYSKRVSGQDCYSCNNVCNVGETLSGRECTSNCKVPCEKRDKSQCFYCPEPIVAPQDDQVVIGDGFDTDDDAIETGTGIDKTKPFVCSDYCASKGYTSTKPDFSGYILSQLNQYSCSSKASVRYAGGITVSQYNCQCYSKQNPSVSVDSAPLVCQSSCGPVTCGGSTSCSCGDGCTRTVTCNWSGWVKSGDGYTPSVSTVNS